MNDHESPPEPWNDPALEARIVACVLGETSAFEAAEIEKLVSAHPELALFKRRIEAAHALVGSAERGEIPKIQLSADRRRKLLETLGVPAVAPPENLRALSAPTPWWSSPLLVRAAACLIMTGLAVALLSFLPLDHRAPARLAVSDEEGGFPPTEVRGGAVHFRSSGPSADLKPPVSANRKNLEPSLDALLEGRSDDAGPAGAGAGSNGGVFSVAGVIVAESAAGSAGTPAEAPSRQAAQSGDPVLAKVTEALVLAEARQEAAQQVLGEESEIAQAAPGAGREGNRNAKNKQDEMLFAFQDTPAPAAAPALRAREAGRSAADEVAGTVMSGLKAEAQMQEALTVAEPAPPSVATAAPAQFLESSSPSIPPAAEMRREGDERVQKAREAMASPSFANSPASPVPDGAVEFDGTVHYGAPIPRVTPVPREIPAASQALLAEAKESVAQGRSDPAERRFKQSLAKDSGDLAARKGLEELQGARDAAGLAFNPVGAATLNVASQSWKSDRPADVAKAAAETAAPGDREIRAGDEPMSTFSLQVGDVSFLLAREALHRGERPDPERIRAEEFYNAFDYGDPAPGGGEDVSCRIEQAADPFFPQRNLVRIAVRVAAAGRATGMPLHLTILLDTSGSMEREDRAASVRRALESLVGLLGPDDRVTLIGFARSPRLLAENVPGDQGKVLIEAAARTPSEGGTNLEAALALASERALTHHAPNGQNRIVLLTDGAANLGDAHPGRLAAQIDRTRQRGVSFDACGVGAKGMNDEMLEALTRRGGGRYYFLDAPEDADEGFARRLAGAFRPAAENVKVQVVFNPARVGRYRLIGFENHRLAPQDFRNDSVPAAELSAEEAGVALYRIEPLPEGSGELGEVFVRFRDPATGRQVERSWTLPYDERAPSFVRAPPALQLAGVSALLAENLAGDDRIDLDGLAPTLNGLRARFGEQPRFGDLLRMFERVRR